MKIALLSDVHANEPALRAVLKDIKGQAVDEIWDLGDFLGYNPYPRQVMDLLADQAAVRLAGNYDLNVAAFSRNRRVWEKTKHPAKFFSFQWTSRQLTASNKRLITKLPHKVRRRVNGVRVLCVHGSPARINETLMMDTPLSRFRELAGPANADVVFFGHTHRPFQKKAGGVQFVNPGSVGRSFDRDPRASYAVLKFQQGKVTPDFRRVPYDLARNLRKMKKNGFPEMLVRSISEARSLDDIISEERVQQRRAALKRVIAFAQKFDYEEDHSHQVALVALLLFDHLQDLHGLGERERFLLHCAGLLHDIGWAQGRAAHHKASRDMILQAGDLPFNDEDKKLVALISRYHRGSVPAQTHKHFRDLPAPSRSVVRKLSALLRVADGLDRRHVKAVDDLRCRVFPGKVEIKVRSADFSVWEASAAKKKADLFESVFKKEVVVRGS